MTPVHFQRQHLFRLILDDAGGRNEGTRSLSRVTDGTTGFGNLRPYGLHFPVRHPPGHYESATTQFRHCHNVTIIKTEIPTHDDNTQRAQLSVAIDSSRSVNCHAAGYRSASTDELLPERAACGHVLAVPVRMRPLTALFTKNQLSRHSTPPARRITASLRKRSERQDHPPTVVMPPERHHCER